MLALDTNILITLQKLEPLAAQHYNRALQLDTVAVPAIVRHEARRGLPKPEHQRRLNLLDTLLLGHQTLSFDQDAADIASAIYHDLRTAGVLIDEADVLIAATALRHNATLITRNTKHFQRIPGLNLDDWQQENP